MRFDTDISIEWESGSKCRKSQLSDKNCSIIRKEGRRKGEGKK